MSRRTIVYLVSGVVFVTIVGLMLFLQFGEPVTQPDQPEKEAPIFPFATTSDQFFAQQDPATTTADTAEDDQPKPDLWQVTDDPVAGSRWVKPQQSDIEKIWYVKQRSGHVFAANPQTRNRRQLTDTTVPQVREAIIGPNGKYIIYRYLGDDQTIRTYLGSTQKQNGDIPYAVDGSFLAPDIYEITMNEDGSKLFFLQETQNGSVGTVYNLTTGKSEQIFTSDISQWRASFGQSNTVIIYTPAADDIHGYAYRINITTGERTRLTAGQGLTVLPSHASGAYLQTTQTQDSTYQTQAFTEKQSGPVFSVGTFSDKCSWEAESVFLCAVPQNNRARSITSWYQGTVNVTDQLSIFNTESNNQDELLTDEQIDRVNADVDSIDVNQPFTHLIFNNRVSGTLWGLAL